MQLSCSDLYLHLSTQLQKQLWSAPNYLIVMTERCFQQLIIIPLTWFDPYCVFPKSHSYKYLIILYNLVLVVLISSSCLTYTTSYRSYILARFTYTYSKWLLFPPLVWPMQPVFTDSCFFRCLTHKNRSFVSPQLTKNKMWTMTAAFSHNPL